MKERSCLFSGVLTETIQSGVTGHTLDPAVTENGPTVDTQGQGGGGEQGGRGDGGKVRQNKRYDGYFLIPGSGVQLYPGLS